jgi:hypothetical protein
VTDDRTREPLGAAPAPEGWEVLERLLALPVSSWRYTWEPDGVRHLGPMAQDFMAAFGLGSDDTIIEFVDANGVLTVALQALARRIAGLEARIAALEAERG